MKNSSTGSFWKSFFALLFIYAVLIPVVFAILDWQLLTRYFQKDAGLLVLMILGAASSISLVISLWSRHDRRLHRW